MYGELWPLKVKLFRHLLAAVPLLVAVPAPAASRRDATDLRLYETARHECERDCGLLMKCVRSCCGDLHDCLAAEDCEDRSIACMR